MPVRLLEIAASDSLFSTIKETAEKHEAIDLWHSSKNKDGRRNVRILVDIDQQQELMDDLQKKFSREKNWRIVVTPVDATLPKHEDKKDGNKSKIVRGNITREELYTDIRKGTRIDQNFILLVILSTIVAAIGLINDNVAVVIGAMVIAPLLGPNIALAFASALGDKDLIKVSILTNATGLGITLLAAILGGVLLNLDLNSHELMSRTEIGVDGLVLAFASGAAGVLSITTGLSGTLVGVMVAVALMPPAVAFGLMLGAGHFDLAYGAGLLLAANVVCVNIAAQIMFLVRGFKPRTWYMRKKSEQSVKTNIAVWLIMLAIIIALIYLRSQ